MLYPFSLSLSCLKKPVALNSCRARYGMQPNPNPWAISHWGLPHPCWRWEEWEGVSPLHSKIQVVVFPQLLPVWTLAFMCALAAPACRYCGFSSLSPSIILSSFHTMGSVPWKLHFTLAYTLARPLLPSSHSRRPNRDARFTCILYDSQCLHGFFPSCFIKMGKVSCRRERDGQSLPD